MNVTRDVILDLLPLYLAGEASADTRALVDGYLAQDPELARTVSEQRAAGDFPLAGTPAPPLTKEHELKTLERTKTMLKLRSILMGVAIFFSLIPIAGYQIGSHRWSMISDFPAGAIASGLLGVVAWGAYFTLNRRLRSTGV